MGPHPAVAAVRTAVRGGLRDLVGSGSGRVLLAVSGGPDSLALLAAACFVAPRLGLVVGAATVDHGLQEGSVARARAVAGAAARAGADPVSIWHVAVRGGAGPEAAARDARYDALLTAAAAMDADAVLLGHTRDDQAETVLLGLARGSGPRSLSGMARHAGLLRRPLLELPRDVVHTAASVCAPTLGLDPWQDPHNVDPAFTRVRVRQTALPALEREIGPGVSAALARTAALVRDDTDALDAWASSESDRCVRAGADGAVEVDAVALSSRPRAVRTRVLRAAACASGAPASDLRHSHVLALDALVMQAAVGAVADLPRVDAIRRDGVLRLERRAAR